MTLVDSIQLLPSKNGYRAKIIFNDGRVARTVLKDWHYIRDCKRCRAEFRAKDHRTAYCGDCQRILPNGQYRPITTWRKRVLARDGNRCVLCGSDKELQADHIKPQALYPELRRDMGNGRTLCFSCHVKTNTFGGRTRRQNSRQGKLFQ